MLLLRAIKWGQNRLILFNPLTPQTRASELVCYTAVFSVVTQRSSRLWGGVLRDDTKNGCVADYKWVSSFLKTMPSEIGFPVTLTSGAFVNKKRNKQTSHELQNNLDSSCISTCAPSRKRQFKPSQDDTKHCQLQLSVSKFPDLHKFSTWTHLSNFD